MAILLGAIAHPAHATTLTLPAAHDAWVWSAVPDNNIGSTTSAEVGRTVSKSGTVLIKRALLHFDLAALPPDAALSAATLRLFIERTSADPLGLDLTAWRLQSSFVEGDGTTGVTWNTQPDVEATPTGTGTMSTLVGSWFDLDVTAVVLAARASPDPANLWLRLAPTDETTVEVRDFAFRTREYTPGAYAAELVCDYEVPTPTYTPTPVPPPTSTATATPTVTPTDTPSGPTLPPDPSTIASEIDRSVATDFYDATTFLYTAPTPVQGGVPPGTIEPRRAAVIRGQVRTRAGAPLPGITVTILDHPEFGSTLTRTDGRFDLAVNGGGPLTVDYTDLVNNGVDYLRVHRQVEVPWNEYVWAPDVVMIPADVATVIDFAAPTDIQVARGSAVTDADGTRQATLLFNPTTTAELVRADGSTVPVTGSLAIRATEYTVGPDGPDAMPAALPPTSGYTYAVELSADEVAAAGAEQVVFSGPVWFYVENFLNFPVGSAVPAGYYDRRAGAWVASDNGRVLAVLSEDPQGYAQLDTDGDGEIDNDATGALGITADERRRLGALYDPGVTLWRVPISHFTPWDCNWPYGPPEDAEDPDAELEEEDEEDEPCQSTGSVLECENQTLGEEIPLVGTPFRLVYRSDRTGGRLGARRRTVRVSGATVPESLKAMELEIRIAGQVHRQTWARLEGEPASVLADRSATFVWDGRDAYGRPVEGTQRATFTIGYVYDATYYAIPADFARAFARLAPNTLFSGSQTRMEVTIRRRLRDFLVVADTRPQGLGGWKLDVHHRFDPGGRRLDLGSGGRRRGYQMPAVLSERIGGGLSEDDGVWARLAAVRYPTALAVAADGSVYVGEYDSEYWSGGPGFGLALIRRVMPDESIATVAGNRWLGQGFSGDGGPAISAQLQSVTDIALGPDGSLYIADHLRVRRVAPDGTIETVAGDGVSVDGGDGGPAIAAGVDPSAITVAPDGTVYVATAAGGISHRVRRIGPDGLIDTIAGGGSQFGDGVAALDAEFGRISGLALGPDGSLYVSDEWTHRVRRIDPRGMVYTSAGTGLAGGGGDGGAALLAELDMPSAVVVTPDGSVVIAEAAGNRVRLVDPAGIIRTVAGGGMFLGPAPDDAPAVGADLGQPVGLALGPNGSAYVAQYLNWIVTRIDVPFSGGLVPSEDGTEVFEFDGAGRHIRTRHGLTGGVLYEFGYEQGRLASVTDGDGNQTTMAYAGTTSVIEAPHHQRTTLAFDGNGYLRTITNPAGEAIEVTHDADGLLRVFEDARDNRWQFTYDSAGRLERDDDPAGGYQTLARASIPNGYQVTRSTREGRDTIYAVERPASGGSVRRVTAPDNTVTETTTSPDGQRQQVLADQTVRQVVQGPDPRFGLQAPVASRSQEATPLGLIRVVNASRVATLTDPFNPLSLLDQTDVVSVNGRPFTRRFAAGPPATLTTTSPLDRQTVMELDERGRVTKRSATGLHPVRYGYDARGRLASITHGPDPDPAGEARVTTFTYKETTDLQNGYLDTVTDAQSRTVQFTYDGAGRVLTQTFLPGTPDERVIGYGYDPNGNLTSLTPPGRPAHGFDYTAVNLERLYAPPVVPLVPAPETTSSYNLDRDLTSIVRPDGRSVLFGYEPGSGRLGTVTLTPESEVRSYTYSPTTGQTASVSSPHAVLSFSYDGSLLTSETWAFVGPPAVSHRVTHGYDSDFRLGSLQIDALPPVAFGHDDDGLLTQAGALALDRDLDNGLLRGTTLTGGVTVADTHTPSLFGEVDAYSTTVDGTPMFSYTVDERDQLGRIVRKTETIEGVSTQYQYGYDAAGRLADVWRLTEPAAHLAHYDYDANGNRTGGFSQVSDAIIPAGTTYDAQDRLEQYETAVDGVVAYTYTANGELATKTDASGTTTTYTYDALGNLRAVVLDDGGPTQKTIEYRIDGRNRRIGRLVDGVFQQGFLYRDQLNLVAGLGPSGAVVAEFVYGSKPHVPDYFIRYDEQSGQPTGTYRILSDHLGSPRLVLDVTSGAVVQRLDCDEFGNVLSDTNPGFQPFGFAGGLHDRDTAHVHFGARDFSPQTGRWHSKDPIDFAGEQTNLFSYVADDPINAIDPTGLICTPSDSTLTCKIKELGARGKVRELEELLDATGLDDKAKQKALREARKLFSRTLKKAEAEFRRNTEFREFVHREFKPCEVAGSNRDLTPQELIDAFELFFNALP